MSDNVDSQLERWRGEAIDAILHKVGKIDMLLEAQKKQEAVLEKMSDAMSKLALVEERQNVSREAMERAFKAIERVEARLEKLEAAAPVNNRTSAWVERLMLTGIGALLLMVLSKVGVKT